MSLCVIRFYKGCGFSLSTEQSSPLKLIRMTDLQSVKSIELPFEESGVFRLDGNNDIGKSAILRGIYALFQNVNSRTYKDYISDWAESFVVEAFFYDGSWIKLSRGASDFYEWSLPNSSDRAENTKGKVPEPIEDYLNLYSEQERTKQVLNFNLPGSPLPFVDTSSLDNYWLLQQALGTEAYLKGTKMLNGRVRDLNKEIKLVFELVEQQNEKLEHITVEIDNDKNKLSSIERFENILKVEYAALNDMYLLETKEHELADLRQNLNDFIQIPDAEFSNMILEGEKLKLMEQTYSVNKEVTDKTLELNSIVQQLNDSIDVDSLLRDVEVIDLATEHCALAEELATLKQASELLDEKLVTIKDIETLNEAIETISLGTSHIEDKKALNVLVSEYDVLNAKDSIYENVTEAQELMTIVEDLETIYVEHSSVNKFKKDLESYISEINVLTDEIEQLKVELGICPFCGSDLTVAHAHK